MTGSRRRKGALTVLASALLLSGLFVGVSYAVGGGITEPKVLELVSTNGCTSNDSDPATECRVFLLTDTGGKESGEASRWKVPLWDVDGNAVGNAFLECLEAKATKSVCTIVLAIQDGPNTDQGTIVATGVGLPPKAITGGSGAYANVRGDIAAESEPDGFHLILNLIP